MARPKKQFTEEQNFRIAQMVEINKTLEEIISDLKKSYGISVHPTTLSKHIESLGLERIDGRKWNADKGKNHKSGETKADKVESVKKVPSKYKLKKYFDGEGQATIHEAKGVGYDENDIPLFYKLNLSKEGYVVDVEVRMDDDLLRFKGGEKCIAGSLRWWMIQRMKFDYGDKFRPLVPGQKAGDWRGVVDRFKYNDDSFLRTNDILPNEMIYLQQEAWERYVDAVASYVGTTKKLSESDRHKNNRYIINAMNNDQLSELMWMGPDVIYYYIPQHLYGTVVNYCITRMENDGRLKRGDEKIAEGLKKIMANASMLVESYDANKITFEVVKKCLDLHPNDYDVVIKLCCGNALNANLIRPNYTKALVDMAGRLFFKSVEDPIFKNECVEDGYWLAANDDRFHRAIYGKIDDLNTVCEKYGLVFGLGI